MLLRRPSTAKEKLLAGNVKFNFDQRAIDRIANEAISEVAAHAQQAFDRVHRIHAGKPVAQVMAPLRSALRSAGWNRATDADLRPMAEAISQGQRIDVRTGKRW